jgi:hypothetical protein
MMYWPAQGAQGLRAQAALWANILTIAKASPSYETIFYQGTAWPI